MSIITSTRTETTPTTTTSPYNAPKSHQSVRPSRYHRNSSYMSSTDRSSSLNRRSISSVNSVSSAPATYSPFPGPYPYLPFNSSSATSSANGHYISTSDSALRQLPQNVHGIILDCLEFLHTGPGQTGCLTCFRRDLHSLSLTCRSWEKAVRGKL